MKKEYIEPTMDVVEIKRSMLLAGSMKTYDDDEIENENQIL